MTEEKTAADEEKKQQEELDQQEITADDLAAGTSSTCPLSTINVARPFKSL